MLSRLNENGGSELGEVLGHIPGIRKEDLDGDTHGGLVETSQLLALHPEWIDPDYKALPRKTVQKAKGIVAGFRAGIDHFTRETYSGAPAGASAEVGERILDTLAGRTAEAIGEILDGTLPREQWHSPFWKLRHLFVNRFAVALADRILKVPRTV
jgi:hypothetical protein